MLNIFNKVGHATTLPRQTIVDYCIMSTLDVATPFRHDALKKFVFFLVTFSLSRSYNIAACPAVLFGENKLPVLFEVLAGEPTLVDNFHLLHYGALPRLASACAEGKMTNQMIESKNTNLAHAQ